MYNIFERYERKGERRKQRSDIRLTMDAYRLLLLEVHEIVEEVQAG